MDSLLLRLKSTVEMELKYMRQLMEVMGTMDTVFAAMSQLDSAQSSQEKLSNHTELLPSKHALAVS